MMQWCIWRLSHHSYQESPTFFLLDHYSTPIMVILPPTCLRQKQDADGSSILKCRWWEDYCQLHDGEDHAPSNYVLPSLQIDFHEKTDIAEAATANPTNTYQTVAQQFVHKHGTVASRRFLLRSCLRSCNAQMEIIPIERWQTWRITPCIIRFQSRRAFQFCFSNKSVVPIILYYQFELTHDKDARRKASHWHGMDSPSWRRRSSPV